MAAMKLKDALQSLGYDLSLINQRDWGHLDKRLKQYREINSIPPARQDSIGRVIYVGESDLDDLRVVADDFLGSPDYLNPLVLK